MTAHFHPLDAGATAEGRRLDETRRRVKRWHRWGPYLADRAWGTVREDYSGDSTPWEYFPHDHARSRAYRWNEDGLAGFCDRHQHIGFALALWNGRDPFLKERLFGLTNHEGNHGEDVKECYFYLDNTPTHSYMKCLYRYPQAAFPYAELVAENLRRGRGEPEYELLDTGVFDGDRYFDVQVEYAKADVDDILIRVSVTNRGADAAHLDVLPTIWFRNTWSWSPGSPKPEMRQEEKAGPAIELDHPAYGRRWLRCDGRPRALFTENETNIQRLFDSPNASPFVKDAFHRAVVDRDREAVNPAHVGTKAAAWYAMDLAPGETAEMRLRFTDAAESASSLFADAFTTTFHARIREADELYARMSPTTLSADARNVDRQAVAGLLWSKQFYHYVVEEWLDGDPAAATPPERLQQRNAKWTHVYNEDVLAVPDKWEYPWHVVGPRVPYRGSCSGRRRFREGSARAAAARMGTCTPAGGCRREWAFRRCEPAGSCVGGMARVRSTRSGAAAAAIASSRARIPRCC